MLKKSALILSATVVSVSAFAGGMDHMPAASTIASHVYAGVQVGFANHNEFDRMGDSATDATQERWASYSKSTNNFAGRLAAGYMFNKNLGLEVGVGTFGSRKMTVAASVTTVKATAVNYKSSVNSAWDFGLVGKYCFGDIFAFAKGGFAYVDYTVKNIGGTALKASNWHAMPRAELGLGYHVASNMSATLSYAEYFGTKAGGNVSHVRSAGATPLAADFKRYGPAFGVTTLGFNYSF